MSAVVVPDTAGKEVWDHPFGINGVRKPKVIERQVEKLVVSERERDSHGGVGVLRPDEQVPLVSIDGLGELVGGLDLVSDHVIDHRRGGGPGLGGAPNLNHAPIGHRCEGCGSGRRVLLDRGGD